MAVKPEQLAQTNRGQQSPIFRCTIVYCGRSVYQGQDYVVYLISGFWHVIEFARVKIDVTSLSCAYNAILGQTM